MRKPYGNGSRKARIDTELDPLHTMEMGRSGSFAQPSTAVDDDSGSEDEEDTFCQQIWKRMGITYFLPASYHQDQNKRRIEKVARKMKRTLREQKKILEQHLFVVNEMNIKMEDSKRRLTDAFIRSKGQNDVSTMALKTQMMAVRTELSNAIRRSEVARAQFDKTARMLGILEIEETMTFGEKASLMFAEHAKGSRDATAILQEKSGKQASLAQYSSGIHTLADLDVIDSDVNHGEMPDLESIDRMVDECLEMATKKIKGVSKPLELEVEKEEEPLIDMKGDVSFFPHVPV